MANNCIFICPDFFNYKELIEKELSFRYEKVYSFSDRPECSSLHKALIKYNILHFQKIYARKHSKLILDYISDGINDISIVFIVKGTCIDRDFLTHLKIANPKINIVIYSWDSVKNAPNFLELSKFADSAFSFDPEDCLKYKFSYIPLFFYNNMEENRHIIDKKYDFSFVGSYHSDRVAVLNRFLLNHSNANSFIKIFFQSRLQYLFYFFYDRDLRCMPASWLTFNVLSNADIEDVYRESTYVIDIHHPSQSGLTMRTWEALSSTTALYTTNIFTLLHDMSGNVRFIERLSGLELNRNTVLDRVEKYQCLLGGATSPLDIETWINHLFKNTSPI
jgi:hypothetical protein